VISPERDAENVPGDREAPPVPPFSILFPNEAGRMLEDYLRHLMDGVSSIQVRAAADRAQLQALTEAGSMSVGLTYYLSGCC